MARSSLAESLLPCRGSVTIRKNNFFQKVTLKKNLGKNLRGKPESQR